MVVPNAMRIMCLKPARKYCHLGRLSHEMGWKYKHVVRTLELKRKLKTDLRSHKHKHLKKLTHEAGDKVPKQVEPYIKIIKSYGYNLKCTESLCADLSLVTKIQNFKE